MTERTRLLIADDHPIVRAGLQEVLGSRPDFEVVGEATTGAEAVALTDRLRPKVVLMDLRMPEMDGVTAIARIKARHPDVHILVLTTEDSDADIFSAIEAGATGYLLKDSPREELFEAVRAAAQGKPLLAPAVTARLMERIRAPAEEATNGHETEGHTPGARGESNKEIASRKEATDPPTGTVTFLFADIEGSTALHENYPDQMSTALGRHDEILRGTVEARRGYLFSMGGEAYCAAFTTASEALGAALAVQRALFAEPWPQNVEVRVRMGLHSGVTEACDGSYSGSAVNRAARLTSAGHGGQVLLSDATYDLVREHLVRLEAGAELRDLGEHRLRDPRHTEHVFQLVVPDLPRDFEPLKTRGLVTPTVETPNLVGLNRSEASTTLATASLEIGGQNAAPSDAASEGEIIGQQPAAGTKAERGSSVSITVSSGPSTVRVPDLTGKKVSQASGTLAGTLLTLGDRNEAPNETIPKGEVVGQSPEAGTEVKPGSPVSVTVSSGPEEKFTVSDASGRSLGEARQALPSAGLVPAGLRKEKKSRNYPGTVISTDPSAGSKVASGTPATPTVSSVPRRMFPWNTAAKLALVMGLIGLVVWDAGDDTLSVPDLVGQTEDVAQRSAGDDFDLEVSGREAGDEPKDTILSQDPEPGDQAQRGSAISVVMSDGQPEDPTRHFEEEGGFSFVPPEGWQLIDFPGSEYKVALGTPSAGFAPNINVVDEASGGTLDEYVRASIETLQEASQDFRIVSQDDFRPNEGDRAVRLAAEDEQQGTRLLQLRYFFDGGSRKFVVTCSRSADGQGSVDAACDESIKTFRIEPR